MSEEQGGEEQTRRQFLFSAVPAGVVGCLGCPGLLNVRSGRTAPPQSLQERARLNSNMSFEEVYNFAYRDGFIPLAKHMAAIMGEDEFMAALREAGWARGKEAGAIYAAQTPNNAFSTFTENMRNPPPLHAGALTMEIVEDSPGAFEVKISECLWAKTFKEADAAEIGYACICHPDYSLAEGFNPSMRMIRTKTLMQGHDCCNHRWVVED